MHGISRAWALQRTSRQNQPHVSQCQIETTIIREQGVICVKSIRFAVVANQGSTGTIKTHSQGSCRIGLVAIALAVWPLLGGLHPTMVDAARAEEPPAATAAPGDDTPRGRAYIAIFAFIAQDIHVPVNGRQPG